MIPLLEEALAELFTEGSPVSKDVRDLMELAVQETLKQCIQVADDFGSASGNDSSGQVCFAISRQIKSFLKAPEEPVAGQPLDPPSDVTVRCKPCAGCGGFRKEDCTNFGLHGHVWCDCQ